MNWQKVLAQGFDSAEALLDFLGLPKNLAHVDAERQFNTRVPRGFAARMQPGNPFDPLLLQVLASPQELKQVEAYVKDPLAENMKNPLPGVLHKYHGRVLITLTGVCAVNCRYCFRRHFPYNANNPGRKGWQSIFDYIQADSSIAEVVLSGGDPLIMPDRLLQEFVEGLCHIKHLKVLRFHTRIPIVLPERIDTSFLSLLEAIPLQKVMVLHANHAQEINEAVKHACQAMQQAGCTLLNQAVLLSQINDSVDTLAALSWRLFECGVLPYYLHVLDKVAGSVHFDLPEDRACALHKQLQATLPGYLVPRLVREVPGEASKVAVIL